ncbi:MAG: hypothetical protein SNG49_05890 [Rikenellaceae bacterium]
MKYTLRAVKYFCMIALLFIVVTFFMNFSGDLQLTPSEQWSLFMADNGALKIAVLVVLSAIYPYFGYVKRDVEGTIEEFRGQIDVAMESSGFTFVRERDGVLEYRANTILRRVTFLFEDTVTVSQVGGSIRIEGIRRGIVYIYYYLDNFIKNYRRAMSEGGEVIEAEEQK